MSSKIAVVTGANKGIGLAIVRGLCKRFDGDVYLTSRDVERGHQAVKELEKEGLTPKYHQLDITDKKSVEIFRDYAQKNYDGIDILVNNAAVAFKNSATEPVAVQAEQTLFVNYFSLVSACDILFPIIKNGARVVNVSSSAGHLSKIPSKSLRNRLKDPELTVPQLTELVNEFLDATRKGTHVADWGNSCYSVSKVAMTALTMIHQREYANRDISINAVHPGFVDTDMTSHKGLLTVDQGAEAPLYLALDAPATVKGEYVWFNKQIVSWEVESYWRLILREIFALLPRVIFRGFASLRRSFGRVASSEK